MPWGLFRKQVKVQSLMRAVLQVYLLRVEVALQGLVHWAAFPPQPWASQLERGQLLAQVAAAVFALDALLKWLERRTRIPGLDTETTPA